MTSLVNATKHLRKNWLIFLNFFQKVEEEGTHPKSVCEVNVTLISKPGKGIPKKENNRPVCLMNIGAKSTTEY